MSYSLYVKVNDVWVQVDIGTDTPAMNFQTNDVAELKNRQADYSQALKLPKTPKNRMIFQNADCIDIVTDIPYQKHECRLFSNGYVIAGIGYYLILNRISEYFEVQILSGVRDFFNLLDAPLSDVDLGSLIRNEAAVRPENFTDRYVYAAATFIKGGAPIYQDSLSHIFPFINIKKVIETLVTSKGYTLETDLTNEQWQNKYISLSTVASNFPEYRGKASFLGYTAGGSIPFTINENASGKFDNSIGLRYQTGSLYCNLKISCLLDSSTSGYCEIKKVSDGVETIVYSKSAPYQKIEMTIPLSVGDEIRITSFAGPDSDVIAECILEVVPANVPYNEKLPFSYNLGFSTQADFFKAILQLFGLTPLIDMENKKVYAYTMNKLYENKAIAKNWSNKLHVSDSDAIVFSFGSYAQKNYLRFADNTDDNRMDNGIIEINNTTLEEAKDLFILPFQAGLDDYVQGDYVANIPLEEITDIDIVFKGCPPHIVELSDDTIPFTITGMYGLNYKKATHIKAQTFVDDFYSGYTTMLNPAKYIEVLMNLTDQDIEEFNPFIPVYIQKFGHYFYVNKIKNYISGKLTQCQLIKL